MSLGFVDGQIRINNVAVPVVPGTVNRKKGRGETSVEAQSLGAGIVDTVHTVDTKTMVSFFHFSMKPTVENMAFVDAWKLAVGLNTIKYIGEETNEVYEQMSVTNDPEYPDSNDGVIVVEFEGNPLIK